MKTGEGIFIIFWPFLNRGGIIEQELELGNKKTNFNTLKHVVRKTRDDGDGLTAATRLLRAT